MPQMVPLLWTNLMILFIMTFLIMSSLTYVFVIPGMHPFLI